MINVILRPLCAMLAGAVALLLVYYEGLPVLGDVWFIQKIPVIGELAEGKVSRAARIAAAAAREGYVRKAEKIALEAQLNEERRQRLAGEKTLADFKRRQAEAEQLDQQQSEENEKRIAEYEKALADAGRSCFIDDADRDFILRHH